MTLFSKMILLQKNEVLAVSTLIEPGSKIGQVRAYDLDVTDQNGLKYFIETDGPVNIDMESGLISL